MGNYRFRLSDMMPNAWFYKLKEMGKSTTRNHNSINKKHPTSTAATANISQHQQQPLKPKQPNNHFSYPRKSYYYTRELIHNSPANSKSTQPHFPDPPRKSSRQRKLTNKRILRHSSPKLVSAGCSCRCRATLWTNKSSDSPPDYSASFSSSDSSDSFPPEFRSDQVLPAATFDKMVAWSSSCGCNQVIDSNADDIIIDVDNKSLGTNFDKLDLSDLDLPPIITKPPKFDDKVEDINKKQTEKTTTGYRKSSAKYKETNAHGSLSVELVKEESVTMKERKSSNSNSFRRHVNSPGLRLRVNSPRIASRRIQAHGSGRKSVSSSSSSSSRRSLSDSLAIVKSSFDPHRDFKESMVEMIVENNIRASKDLEDLLACYLSLNSDEYHGLIIEVFKQIWLDLNETPSKDRHQSSSSTLASK